MKRISQPASSRREMAADRLTRGAVDPGVVADAENAPDIGEQGVDASVGDPTPVQMVKAPLLRLLDRFTEDPDVVLPCRPDGLRVHDGNRRLDRLPCLAIPTRERTQGVRPCQDDPAATVAPESFDVHRALVCIAEVAPLQAIEVEHIAGSS